MNTIATMFAGLIVSALLGQAPTPAPQPQTPKPDTQKATPEVQARPKLVDITRVGCLKAWQPGPPDPTRMPDPPKTGTYILTPLVVDPNRASADMISTACP